MDKCDKDDEIELAIAILEEHTDLPGADLRLAIAGEGRLELSRKASISRIKKLLGETESEELFDVIESFLRRPPEPSDMGIIKVMLRGKWLCTKCRHYRSEKGCGWSSKLACEAWQDQGGE